MTEEDVVEEITNYLTKLLNSRYGFCGVAKGHGMAMLNSGHEKDIIIKIETKEG